MTRFNDTETIDLSSFDNDFRRAEKKETAEPYIDDIPDGLYDTRIEDVTLRRTANTGNPMLVWKLRILGPKCKGRTLTRTRIITQKTLAFLKEDLERLGLHMDRISDLERRMGEMLDRDVRVMKRTRQGQRWPDINILVDRKGPISETPAEQPWSTGTDDDLPF